MRLETFQEKLSMTESTLLSVQKRLFQSEEQEKLLKMDIEREKLAQKDPKERVAESKVESVKGGLETLDDLMDLVEKDTQPKGIKDDENCSQTFCKYGNMRQSTRHSQRKNNGGLLTTATRSSMVISRSTPVKESHFSRFRRKPVLKRDI
jgi:hypothetical protein